MKHLATIKPQEVDPTFVEDVPLSEYVLRIAGRAIVMDGEKVALIHVSGHNYYMLPGGGIDDGEDTISGLAREIEEELGAGIIVAEGIGSIETYMDRWKTRQVDECFVARLGDKTESDAKTDFEISEGHQLVWADNLEHAAALVGDAEPENRDGKLVKARDLLFLNTVLASKQ